MRAMCSRAPGGSKHAEMHCWRRRFICECDLALLSCSEVRRSGAEDRVDFMCKIMVTGSCAGTPHDSGAGAIFGPDSDCPAKHFVMATIRKPISAICNFLGIMCNMIPCCGMPISSPNNAVGGTCVVK